MQLDDHTDETRGLRISHGRAFKLGLITGPFNYVFLIVAAAFFFEARLVTMDDFLVKAGAWMLISGVLAVLTSWLVDRFDLAIRARESWQRIEDSNRAAAAAKSERGAMLIDHSASAASSAAGVASKTDLLSQRVYRRWMLWQQNKDRDGAFGEAFMNSILIWPWAGFSRAMGLRLNRRKTFNPLLLALRELQMMLLVGPTAVLYPVLAMMWQIVAAGMVAYYCITPVLAERQALTQPVFSRTAELMVAGLDNNLLPAELRSAHKALVNPGYYGHDTMSAIVLRKNPALIEYAANRGVLTPEQFADAQAARAIDVQTNSFFSVRDTLAGRMDGPTFQAQNAKIKFWSIVAGLIVVVGAYAQLIIHRRHKAEPEQA